MSVVAVAIGALAKTVNSKIIAIAVSLNLNIVTYVADEVFSGASLCLVLKVPYIEM